MKSEILANAQANLLTAREAYEAAAFALRDAQLLPDAPPVKTWEVAVQIAGDIKARTESGDEINGNLPQVLSGWPGILPEIIEANPNKARCNSPTQPADLCIIYSRYTGSELGWLDDAPVNVAWTEVPPAV